MGLCMLYKLWPKEGLVNCAINEHDILGVCNCNLSCLEFLDFFKMRLYTTLLFSVSFSDEHRATSDEHQKTNQADFLSPLGKNFVTSP